MDETLAWLRAPETEHALRDLLCGLIKDIRHLLIHPDLANADKLTAIARAVDELAPPPGPTPTSVQAAAALAALLARHTGPAPLLFEQLAGEPLRIDLTACAFRPLTPAECRQLHTRDGTHGYQRTGTLRTVNTRLAAAQVTSTLIPGRLPPPARTALGIPDARHPAPPPAGTPLSTVLARYGARREPLAARLTRTTASDRETREVQTAARIWLTDTPVALTSEHVTAQFCRHAANRRT